MVFVLLFYKFGYWKNKEDYYESEGLMSYDEVIVYVRNVLENEKFVCSGVFKVVDVFDVFDYIVVVKVIVWWGIDYILLVKYDGYWMIE